MALDWNKEISLKNLGKARKGKSRRKGGSPQDLARKTSMNLMSHDTTQSNPVTTAIVGVVLAIFVVLFAKFAVIDQLASVNALRNELNQQERVLAAAQAELEEYNSVLSEYQSYSSSDQAGLEYPDALAVATTIDKTAGKYGTVTSVAIGQGVATVNVTDASLKEIGTLAEDLKKQAIFQDVSVSTAANRESASNVDAVLSIALVATGASAAQGDTASTQGAEG